MTESRIEFALATAHARAASTTVVRALDVQTPTGPLLVGVDGAEHKHLFVPVAKDEVVEPHRGVALQIGERVLSGEYPGRVADLHCVEPGLDEFFERLVDSLVSRVHEAGPQVSGQASLRDAVELWRVLLSEHRASREDEQGLFGELHVLGLLGQRDALWALNAWRGPDRARHDFMSDRGALEVKAAGLQTADVSVSSISQLDPAGSPRLGLVRVQLEERPEGITVHDLLERLVTSGLPSALLEPRIHSVLGSDVEAARRFTVASVSLYVVDETFPSLREKDIPAAKRPYVTVRYSLRLDGLDFTPCDDGRPLVGFLHGEGDPQ